VVSKKNLLRAAEKTMKVYLAAAVTPIWRQPDRVQGSSDSWSSAKPSAVWITSVSLRDRSKGLIRFRCRPKGAGSHEARVESLALMKINLSLLIETDPGRQGWFAFHQGGQLRIDPSVYMDSPGRARERRRESTFVCNRRAVSVGLNRCVKQGGSRSGQLHH
jgi:hypothetical protein